MENLKACENCKHYKKHYFWYKGRLRNAGSGHCIGHRDKRLVFYSDCCDKWEFAENARIEQTEEFKIILERTAKQIEEIAGILNAKASR